MNPIILTSDNCQNMDVEELNREATEQFIKSKTLVETQINNFMQSAISLREKYPDIFGGITFPTGTTAKELVPAMYEKDFDESAYNAQVAVVTELNAEFQRVADRVASQPIE